MNTSVEVTEVRPDVRMPTGRHPLGVIAVLLAGVTMVVQLVAVASVGTAAASMHQLYGRELVQIPFGELPPSISIYVIVIGVTWLSWLAALVLGLVSLIRLKCRVCGAIAVTISLATVALVFAAWFATSSGALP